MHIMNIYLNYTRHILCKQASAVVLSKKDAQTGVFSDVM